MSKTLSESAAEILKASMNAGKEPMQSLNAPMVDLGGATPQDDYSGGPGHGEKDFDSSVGVKAAASAQMAPKPGMPGAPAEPSKGAAEEETDAVADAEQPIDGADKALAAKKILKPGEKIGAMKEEAEEVEEISEEDLAEAKKAHMKGMVAKYKGSMKEDVDALFNGESLSEDFRVKATLIFEAAVSSRVEKIVEEVLAENDELLAQTVEEIKSELSEQVDEYLNYVVEEWVNENQVAIETGLRAELAEDFINGLKNLFTEHYIEIPEEKVDLTEELAQKVAELEENLVAIAEEKQAIAKELNLGKKDKLISLACEGLTAVQAGKLKSLAEGVEFTTEGDFEHKLAVIRENYFPSKVSVTSEVKEIQKVETLSEDSEVETVNGIMAHYVKAISKTAPKA
jgi:hypothetical protein